MAIMLHHLSTLCDCVLNRYLGVCETLMCRQGYCSCHYHRDYQSIPRLDTYDREHLDEGAYDTIDPEARVAAEKAMRKRDRQVGGHPLSM